MKPLVLVRSNKRLRRHTGFTLVELLVSLGICTLLIVCLTSSLTLTLKSATPLSNSPVLAHIRTGELADQILSDLAFARSFTINTATDVQFTVPSRDGDTTPETIRYQWAGNPSNLLRRSYNGGPLTPFEQDIQEFELSYLTRSMGPPPPPPPVESAEILLMEHDDAPSGSFSEFSTSTNNWCAQWINPNLTSDAVAWKITRVEFRARSEVGAAANFLIQIRMTNPLTNTPTTTVMSSSSQATNDLPSTQAWILVDIPDAPNLSPETGYCLVIGATQSASKYPKIQLEQSGAPMPSRTHWTTSSNSGTTWSTPDANKDMRFRIYGTVTTQPL